MENLVFLRLFGRK